MEKELTYLGKALEAPARPFVAILGGSKISGKIDVINNLLDKVDTLVIVGGMAYTFQRALGVTTGKSLVEEDRIEMAGEALKKAKALGVELLLPVDNVLADSFSNDAKTQPWDTSRNFPAEWQGLDIGPKSVSAIERIVAGARTIVWNGPAGVFEFPKFRRGHKRDREGGGGESGCDFDCRRRRLGGGGEAGRGRGPDQAHLDGGRGEPGVSGREEAAGGGGSDGEVDWDLERRSAGLERPALFCPGAEFQEAARNWAGVKIGMSCQGCRMSRSSSLLTIMAAAAMRARARNLLSRGSRQAGSRVRGSPW